MLISCLLVEVAQSQPAATNSATVSPEAEKAWKELQKATRAPMPPAEWQGQRPTPEQMQTFRASQAVLAEEAAAKAKDFYTRYPSHPKAADARKKETDMLKIAVNLGSTKNADRLAAMEEERLKDPNLSADERFKLRLESLKRSIMSKQSEGEAAMLAVQEKGARELIKDFPKHDEGYQILLQAAGESASGETKAREIAKEIAASQASDETKKSAQAMLRKLEALGKPLPIKFTSVDGREVDLAKLTGKVVLVDFWATWCGPCVAEIPNVKKTYDELHPKGFEIVGISFDSDKSKLEEFVKKEGMTWPQFCDGKAWGNKFGKEYGINSIPAMWLVDKKGNLRDMNARGGLEEKVQGLLKE